MVKYTKLFTLVDMDIHSYAVILDQYSTINRECVKKSYAKAKAKRRAQERANSLSGVTFYMVGGMLTTEKPERDI